MQVSPFLIHILLPNTQPHTVTGQWSHEAWLLENSEKGVAKIKQLQNTPTHTPYLFCPLFKALLRMPKTQPLLKWPETTSVPPQLLFPALYSAAPWLDKLPSAHLLLHFIHLVCIGHKGTQSLAKPLIFKRKIHLCMTANDNLGYCATASTPLPPLPQALSSPAIASWWTEISKEPQYYCYHIESNSFSFEHSATEPTIGIGIFPLPQSEADLYWCN